MDIKMYHEKFLSYNVLYNICIVNSYLYHPQSRLNATDSISQSEISNLESFVEISTPKYERPSPKIVNSATDRSYDRN